MQRPEAAPAPTHSPPAGLSQGRLGFTRASPSSPFWVTGSWVQAAAQPVHSCPLSTLFSTATPTPAPQISCPANSAWHWLPQGSEQTPFLWPPCGTDSPVTCSVTWANQSLPWALVSHLKNEEVGLVDLQDSW